MRESTQIESMPIAIEILFKDRLRSNNDPFVIPEYQRTYRWGADGGKKIRPLMHSIVNQDEYSMFFGAIIFSATKSNVNQDFKYSTPRVVDGQQRLTTFYLILSRCYLLNIMTLNFEYNLSEFMQLNPDGLLRNVFLGDRQKEHIKPMIIREGDPSCALTYYQLELADKICRWDKKILEFSNDEKTANSMRNTMFGEGFNIIKNGSINRKELQSKLLSLNFYDIDTNVKEAIEVIDDFLIRCVFELDNSDIEEPLDSQDELDIEKVQLNLRKFVKKILKANTVLICIYDDQNDDYALDVFHSLNTGGTPLTSLEAFKSWIYSQLSKNKNEIHYFDLKKSIDNLYSKHKKYLENNLTYDPWMILNDVSWIANKKSLQTQIFDQTLFLRDQYRKSPKNLCDLISLTIQFYLEWDFSGTKNIDEIESKSELWDFSRNTSLNNTLKFYQYICGISKQSISNPLIIYHIFHKTDAHDFDRIIKAICGFTILWRIASGGNEDGISGVFKRLYYNGEKYLNANDLILFFKHELEKKYTTYIEDFWVKRVCSQDDFYGKQSSLKKIFIGITLENHTAIKRGKNIVYSPVVKNVSDSIENPWAWIIRNANSDIEHVAPKEYSASSGWSRCIYDEINPSQNKLGNLTLVHMTENRGILKNKTWDQKKIIYNYISTNNTEDRSELLNDELLISANLDGETIKLIKSINSNSDFGKYYNKHVAEFALEDEVWSKISIDRRSHEFARVGFKTFIEWLK